MGRPDIALAAASRADTHSPSENPPISWLPLIVLSAAVLIAGRHLAPWALMWGLAIAIYGALKWMTWWRGHGRIPQASLRRSLA